jgi:hypothetical protein
VAAQQWGEWVAAPQPVDGLAGWREVAIVTGPQAVEDLAAQQRVELVAVERWADPDLVGALQTAGFVAP